MAKHVSCRAFSEQECDFELIDFDMVEVNHTNPILEDKFVCEAVNEKGCTFRFSPELLNFESEPEYGFENNLQIYFHITDGKKELNCPQSLGLIVSGSIFGLILLAGIIALLIWKCYLVVLDRRAYAK